MILAYLAIKNPEIIQGQPLCQPQTSERCEPARHQPLGAQSQTGFRFSRKATTPSLAAGVVRAAAMLAAPMDN